MTLSLPVFTEDEREVMSHFDDIAQDKPLNAAEHDARTIAGLIASGYLRRAGPGKIEIWATQEGVEQLRFEKEHPVPLGIFTISNTKTGSHRTFKISTAKHGPLAGKTIVGLLTGSGHDDRGSYLGVAFFDPQAVTATVWKKHRANPSSRAVIDGRAWDASWSDTEKAVAMLVAFLRWGPASTFFAMGCRIQLSATCVACGRMLTEPESIRLNIGPTCRSRA